MMMEKVSQVCLLVVIREGEEGGFKVPGYALCSPDFSFSPLNAPPAPLKLCSLCLRRHSLTFTHSLTPLLSTTFHSLSPRHGLSGLLCRLSEEEVVRIFWCRKSVVRRPLTTTRRHDVKKKKKLVSSARVRSSSIRPSIIHSTDLQESTLLATDQNGSSPPSILLRSHLYNRNFAWSSSDTK